MSNDRELLKQALDAMQSVDHATWAWACVEAIASLRAALVEPVQEPVASLMTHVQSGDMEVAWNDDGFDREMWHETPLYAAPPQRKPLREGEVIAQKLAEPHVWVCPEAADTHRYDKPGHCEDCGKTLIQMAEPVQEPVAWQWLNTGHFRKKLPRTAELGNWQPLYAAPPQRKPLTDEEIDKITVQQWGEQLGCMKAAHRAFVRAIERAHGIGEQE